MTLKEQLAEYKITNRLLAKAAGVSHITVGKYLNGKSGISKETEDKILQAARALIYKDPTARIDPKGPYRLTFMHFGHLLLEHDDTKVHAFFYTGHKRTITGARDKHGNCLLMNARELVRYLGCASKAQGKPGDVWHFNNVNGVLDDISATDIATHTHAYGFVSVSVSELAKVFKAMEKK